MSTTFSALISRTCIIYSTFISGSSGRRGWDVQFAIFPLDNHTIKIIDRKKLIIAASDEDEKEYDRQFDNSGPPSTLEMPPMKPTDKPKTPKDDLPSMPSDGIADARSFISQWGKYSVDTVQWTIQKDDKFLDWGKPNIDEHKPMEEIPFVEDTKISDIFFEHTPPCIKGHIKLLDKYLSNNRVTEHHTYMN
jgi:hypothetical protein